MHNAQFKCGLLAPLLLLAGCPQSVPLPGESEVAGGGPTPNVSQTGPGVANDASSDSSGNADAPAQAEPAGVARPSAPMLFLYGNRGHVNVIDDGVFALASPAGLHGDYTRNAVAPATYIPGTYGFPIWYDPPLALAVDRAGSLVALIDSGMLVFHNAQTATGNLRADRELDVIWGPWIPPEAMVMDRERDRLFVSVQAHILVFDGFSSIPDGDVAPSRIIESVDFEGAVPRHLALSAGGDLYAAMGKSVVVFADAGNRDGRILADRIIRVEGEVAGSLIRHWSVFVDQQDRLYVVDANTITNQPDIVYVLDQASTRDGDVIADRKMQFEKLPEFPLISPRYLVVDAAGVGYVTDFENAAIHIVENIGTRDGTVALARSIWNIGWECLYLWE